MCSVLCEADSSVLSSCVLDLCRLAESPSESIQQAVVQQFTVLTRQSSFWEQCASAQLIEPVDYCLSCLIQSGLGAQGNSVLQIAASAVDCCRNLELDFATDFESAAPCNAFMAQQAIPPGKCKMSTIHSGGGVTIASGCTVQGTADRLLQSTRSVQPVGEGRWYWEARVHIPPAGHVRYGQLLQLPANLCRARMRKPCRTVTLAVCCKVGLGGCRRRDGFSSRIRPERRRHSSAGLGFHSSVGADLHGEPASQVRGMLRNRLHGRVCYTFDWRGGPVGVVCRRGFLDGRNMGSSAGRSQLLSSSIGFEGLSSRCEFRADPLQPRALFGRAPSIPQRARERAGCMKKSRGESLGGHQWPVPVPMCRAGQCGKCGRPMCIVVARSYYWRA